MSSTNVFGGGSGSTTTTEEKVDGRGNVEGQNDLAWRRSILIPHRLGELSYTDMCIQAITSLIIAYGVGVGDRDYARVRGMPLFSVVHEAVNMFGFRQSNAYNYVNAYLNNSDTNPIATTHHMSLLNHLHDSDLERQALRGLESGSSDSNYQYISGRTYRSAPIVPTSSTMATRQGANKTGISTWVEFASTHVDKTNFAYKEDGVYLPSRRTQVTSVAPSFHMSNHVSEKRSVVIGKVSTRKLIHASMGDRKEFDAVEALESYIGTNIALQVLVQGGAQGREFKNGMRIQAKVELQDIITEGKYDVVFSYVEMEEYTVIGPYRFLNIEVVHIITIMSKGVGTRKKIYPTGQSYVPAFTRVNGVVKSIVLPDDYVVAKLSGDISTVPTEEERILTSRIRRTNQWTGLLLNIGTPGDTGRLIPEFDDIRSVNHGYTLRLGPEREDLIMTKSVEEAFIDQLINLLSTVYFSKAYEGLFGGPEPQFDSVGAFIRDKASVIFGVVVGQHNLFEFPQHARGPDAFSEYGGRISYDPIKHIARIIISRFKVRTSRYVLNGDITEYPSAIIAEKAMQNKRVPRSYIVHKGTLRKLVYSYTFPLNEFVKDGKRRMKESLFDNELMSRSEARVIGEFYNDPVIHTKGSYPPPSHLILMRNTEGIFVEVCLDPVVTELVSLIANDREQTGRKAGVVWHPEYCIVCAFDAQKNTAECHISSNPRISRFISPMKNMVYLSDETSMYDHREMDGSYGTAQIEFLHSIENSNEKESSAT